MTRTIRRGLLAGSGGLAAVLVVASVAYACTIFYGSLEVTSGATSQLVSGNGDEMDWCSETFSPDSASDGTKSAEWDVRTSGSNPSITIVISDSPNMPCTVGDYRPLVESEYSVRVRSGYMEPGGTSNHNCHGFSGGTLLDEEFQVDENGEGSDSYNIGTTTAGWNSVCVYDNSSADANALNFKQI